MLMSMPHDTNLVKKLIGVAEPLVRQDAYASMEYVKVAMALSDSLHYKHGKAISLGVSGVNYDIMSNYKEALFCYLQALRLAEELQNVKLQAVVLSSLGSVYMWLEKYDLSYKYHIEAMVLYKKINNEFAYASVFNNLGIIAYRQGKIKEAIMYYNKSIDGARLHGDSNTLSASLLNMGELYAMQKDYRRSEDYYNQGLALQRSKRDIINCISGLGYVYLKEGDLKKAEKALQESRVLSENAGNFTSLIDIYDYLVLLYEKKGDLKKSLEYHRKYHNLSKSIYNQQNAKQINEMQTAYQIEKKNKEIQLLNQSKQIAEATAEKGYLVRNFGIAALVFIVMISIAIGRNIVLKQRVKNKELSEKNTVIEMDNAKLLHENSEAKYELLKSKTNPHFLFNNLTVLSSLIIKNQDAAVDFVGHFSNLYRLILKSEDQKLVTIEEEMKLVNHYLYMQQVWYKDALKVTIDIEERFLLCRVPSFTIQMLVENVIKHNIISDDSPVELLIRASDEEVLVQNTLRRKHTNVISTFVGHKNITERYKSVTGKTPEFRETGGLYISSVPLLLSETEMLV